MMKYTDADAEIEDADVGICKKNAIGDMNEQKSGKTNCASTVFFRRFGDL